MLIKYPGILNTFDCLTKTKSGQHFYYLKDKFSYIPPTNNPI